MVVADDSEPLCALISHALARPGLEVVEAHDGHALWAELHREEGGALRRTDLLITDVRMPRCSGLAVVEMIREAHRAMPVIVITSFPDDVTRSLVRALGAVLVPKPFELTALVAEAVRCLGGP